MSNRSMANRHTYTWMTAISSATAELKQNKMNPT